MNAPVVRDRKGEYEDLLEHLRNEGFTRVKVDGEQRLLDEEIELDKKFKHTIEVVVDRLVMKPDLRHRLADSVETALALAERLVTIDVVDGETMTFSEQFACPEHGVGLPELQPRIFSFNSPHGACPRCTGLGSQQRIDPDLLVPDPTISIGEGALVPWSIGASNYYEAVIQAIADRYEIDLDTPVGRAVRGRAEPLPLRHGRRPDLRPVPEPDGPSAPVHDELRGHRLEPRAPLPRDRLATAARADRGVHDLPRPVPECKGARLKPEVLAVTVGEQVDPRVHADVREPRRSPSSTSSTLTETEQLIGARIVKEIRERLTFLDNVGVGYLALDRASATLSGGEAQRLRLATQIGSQLVGVLYILDEPSIGLHQRDNDKLITTLERLRDLGNTVLVVEHDEQMMRSADWLVDMGPGAGEHGGHVVAEGPAEEVEREPEVDHGPVPVARADRSRCRSAAPRTSAASGCAARRCTT